MPKASELAEDMDEDIGGQTLRYFHEEPGFDCQRTEPAHFVKKQVKWEEKTPITLAARLFHPVHLISFIPFGHVMKRSLQIRQIGIQTPDLSLDNLQQSQQSSLLVTALCHSSSSFISHTITSKSLLKLYPTQFQFCLLVVNRTLISSQCIFSEDGAPSSPLQQASDSLSSFHFVQSRTTYARATPTTRRSGKGWRTLLFKH